MMCISALGALRMAQGCSVEFRELCGASRRALHRATHSLALHTAKAICGHRPLARLAWTACSADSLPCYCRPQLQQAWALAPSLICVV